MKLLDSICLLVMGLGLLNLILLYFINGKDN